MSEPSKPEDFEPADETAGEIKPFLDHLEDFRWMIIRMATALAVAMLISFGFGKQLFALIKYPLYRAAENPEDFLFTPFEVAGTFTLAIKLAFYSGLVLSAPLLLFFLLDFVLPALTFAEKRMVRPILAAAGLLFAMGVALAYFAVIPAALKFFIGHSQYFLGLTPKWSTTDYVAFVTQTMLAFGLSFEFPLIVLALAKMGIVSHEFLRTKRPYVVVFMFILAAVITPSTDIISQLFMAIPLCLLFEACIWITKWMERRRAS
jgi:sec-independent protein translocase protein TatC